MIQKLSTTDLYQQVPLNNNNNNNYYYYNNQYYYNANSQLNSSTSPEIIQHMNFFQDVITVCDDEVCPYEHHQHSSVQQQQQQDDNKLRYHTSVRGKKLIQVNQGEDSMPAEVAGGECGKDEGDASPCIENVQLKIEEKQQQQQQQCTYTEQGERQDELGGELGLLSSPNQDNINIMRRPTIITRRASMPLTDDNLLMQQQYQQQYQQYQQQQQYLFDQQKMNALSPLQFLSLTATKKELEKYKSAGGGQEKAQQQEEKEEEEEEEDMSLADLQKSLRQVGLQQHTRSPSASSIHDLQKRSSRYMNSPSIVAPAIPPHQYIQQQQFHHHHPQQQQLYLFDYDQQKQLKQQQQHQIQQQYHQQQQQKLKMFLPSTSSSHQQQHPHHYSNNIYP
ncbi:hypothetical protein FB192DRAFT_1400705 [Mucor lusitanicus]|nr:hypothetical protein FB192DRAFT_1400705 [Mucor lusitanicus]